MRSYKMIRFLILTVLMVSALLGQAQNSSRDSLMKVVTQDVCTELENKNFTSKNMDELQMEVGMAFMPAMLKHKDALEKEFGGNLYDKDGMEKMAQEIGMRLLTDCPSFLKIMGNMEMGGMVKPSKQPVATNEAVIKGTLVKVVPGELTHLLVKDSKGKMVKIWWMDYFDGSDEMADNPQKMTNKKVTVKYTEKEVYIAALKQYGKIKVVSGVSFD